MKILTTLAALLCCAHFTHAQIKKPVLNDSSVYPAQPLLLQERVIGKTPYGTVYALPQDNMPVVAADSNLVKQIPNGFKGTKKRVIPNPMYPNRNYRPFVIPDSTKRKLIITPDKKQKRN